MKKALTRKQEESYQCILRYTNEHGYPPTIREFGKLIGVKSTSSWNDTGEVLCTEWCDAQ